MTINVDAIKTVLLALTAAASFAAAVIVGMGHGGLGGAKLDADHDVISCDTTAASPAVAADPRRPNPTC